jgi:hypothetical protein
MDFIEVAEKNFLELGFVGKFIEEIFYSQLRRAFDEIIDNKILELEK